MTVEIVEAFEPRVARGANVMLLGTLCAKVETQVIVAQEYQIAVLACEVAKRWERLTIWAEHRRTTAWRIFDAVAGEMGRSCKETLHIFLATSVTGWIRGVTGLTKVTANLLLATRKAGLK